MSIYKNDPFSSFNLLKRQLKNIKPSKDCQASVEIFNLKVRTKHKSFIKTLHKEDSTKL